MGLAQTPSWSALEPESQCCRPFGRPAPAARPGTRYGCTAPPANGWANRVVGENELTGDALDLAGDGLTVIAYSAAPDRLTSRLLLTPGLTAACLSRRTCVSIASFSIFSSGTLEIRGRSPQPNR